MHARIVVRYSDSTSDAKGGKERAETTTARAMRGLKKGKNKPFPLERVHYRLQMAAIFHWAKYCGEDSIVAESGNCTRAAPASSFKYISLNIFI